MKSKAPSAAVLGRVLRQLRAEGIETTGVVLQPDGRIEVRTRPHNELGGSEESVRDEIARHFG